MRNTRRLSRTLLAVQLVARFTGSLLTQSIHFLKRPGIPGQLSIKTFLPLLFVFVCYCSIETQGQTIVFGPEKFIRSQGTPHGLAKIFSVENPTGSFDLIIQKSAGEAGTAISAVIKLNGIAVVDEADLKKPRIIKKVTLQRRNTISVQLSGEPGDSITLTISPPVGYTLYTHPDEPRLLSAEFPDGRTVVYFGEKDSAGTATSLRSAAITDVNGEVTNYVFDEQSRVAEIRSPNGLRLKFKWDSDTEGLVTLISPDGKAEVTAPIDLKDLSSKHSGVHNHHPLYRRPIPLSGGSSVDLFPALETASAITQNIAPGKCQTVAKLISKACKFLDAFLVPGVDRLVCGALATAALASVSFAPFAPLIWESCEVALAAAQLFCLGFDHFDVVGNADQICANVKNFFTDVTNFIIGKGPVVSVSLQLSPASSYSVGQSVSGSFGLTNRGRVKAVMSRVLIGGRIGGVCPNNVCPDFTTRTNITLEPGRTYNYSGSVPLSREGTYTFSVAYQKPDGKWVMPVDSENGMINKRSITVRRLAPKPVVSASLRLVQGSGPYSVGQRVDGTFSIANRGNANLVMKRVLIGGRVAGACPNNVCPDFTPVPSNITLAPGQTYNYSGSLPLQRNGSYTFTVAYQKPDGSWVNPVDPENGTINKLNITVQSAAPKPVVSASLRLAQGNGPFGVGQKLDGSFSITNRGKANLVMKQVLIGGRIGGACPNNVCPDFTPVPSNVTIAPGKTYNYSGSLSLPRNGTYTLTVAYQKPDGSWVNPVDPENGTINKLNITVQSAVSKPVVSTSLRLAQGKGPFRIGQKLDGSFSITNRGNANLAMKQVLIGGRVDHTCPNNVCPDFEPIPRGITLAPGQTFNYSGTFYPQRTGIYTLYVACQRSDGKWEMPVDSENGTTNTLNVTVQGEGPTLTGISPVSPLAGPNAQTVYLSGTRLADTTYCHLQLPNGRIVVYWVLRWEIFSRRNNQLGAKIKFPVRGRYYISAKSRDGLWSNALRIVVN